MGLVIKPQPSRRGLFDLATPISGSDVDWSGNGWRLQSTCPVGGLHTCEDAEGDAIADPTLLKADSVVSAPVQFKPFMAYQVAGCKAGTARTQQQLTDSRASSTAWLELNLEGWVSAGLEVGTGAVENVGLVDLTDVTGAASEDLYDSISVLLRNRTRLGMFDRPLIHLPSWAAPQLDTRMIDDVADLVFGPGYGVLDEVTPATETDGWVYITGPVEYAIIQAADLGESMIERRMNITYALSEAMAIVRFDPCGGFKIQATIT